jgi:uncharacterized coiled-coil protein SlyX
MTDGQRNGTLEQRMARLEKIVGLQVEMVDSLTNVVTRQMGIIDCLTTAAQLQSSSVPMTVLN